MTDIDTNISNYTLAELMTIVGIDDQSVNEEQIMTNTNALIHKFKKKNPDLSVFFKEVQEQLLSYVSSLEEYDTDEDYDDEDDKIIVEGFGNNSNSSNSSTYSSGDKQISDWTQNEYLTQDNKTQTDKITQRQTQSSTFGNQHVPAKRQQLATTDTYNLPVKQDSLNPNLKNTITRFLNLDSQFRQYSNDADSTSTNYTCDLSDTLKDTLKLSLYSYQIPYSWYVIDSNYGNTCMWVRVIDSSFGIINIKVSIKPGNYSPVDFVSELNTSFSNAGFLRPPQQPGSVDTSLNIVEYNSNNGIITLHLHDCSFFDVNFSGATGTITINHLLIFYDFTGELNCNNNCLNKTNNYFNNTLGWLMGYRVPYVNVDSTGNVAPSILDLNGTKYLILSIDDYNQNHVNNSLVSISQNSNTLKVPSYYSPDLPQACINPGPQNNNLNELINEANEESLLNNQTYNTSNGLLIAGKYEGDYTKTTVVLPSAPRTLTNAQIYTINSINSNNNNLTNYLAKAPTSSDILAIIPIKTSAGVPTTSLLVEFSGSLQNSSRVYFGPVDIDRMAIKLLDDKGNVLNLNGADWCVSLVCECLYQY